MAASSRFRLPPHLSALFVVCLAVVTPAEAQQIAYTGIVLMGIGSLLTGLAIYKPTRLWWITALCGGYESARLIHFMLTIGYCLFFLVHIAQVIRAGWNNFQAMVTGWEVVRKKGEEHTPTASVDPVPNMDQPAMP